FRFPMIRRKHSRGSAFARRGYSLLEMVIASALLGAVLTVALNTFHWIAVDRRASDQEQEALAEVANQMERIGSRPWDSLTNEGLRDVRLSDHAKRQLPGAVLEASVGTEAATPEAKRISIELAWRNRAGQMTLPTRLVAFVYQPSGGP